MKILLWTIAAVLGALPLVLADEAMDALRAQVALERRNEQELQALQVEVERLKLELEKKKTALELGRLSAADGGAAPDGAAVSGGAAKVVLRYVFIQADKKEAFFYIDGRECRAGEGGDVAGRTVVSINADGAILKEKDGAEVLYQARPY